MSQKIVIFIILVSAIFIIPIWAIQTNPNIPTVNSVSAADDGDTSWGGGSECEGYSGPPCTNPQVTTRCYPYSTYPSPTCPSPGQFCDVECDQGSTGQICMPLPSPSQTTTTTTSPVSTYPQCGGSVLVAWRGLENIRECARVTGYKVERREVDSNGNPLGPYTTITTMGVGYGYTDNNVVIGKHYQYKVTAIVNSTDPSCQPSAPSGESEKNTIVACPSTEPASSIRPTVSTTPTAPSPSTATAPRGRYVCRTITSPNTDGGSQLQLQTLKCEYVN